MWRRSKPSMLSCRKIDDLSIVRQIEPDKKGQKISDFLIFFSDYGMNSGDYRASDYGKIPGKPATFRLFQKPATFAKMPATFQRLWRISGKILEFPEKSAENRFFRGKIGAKTEKWDIFPIFRKNRGRGRRILGPSIQRQYGRFGGCFPFPGIGVFLGQNVPRGRAAAPAPAGRRINPPQEYRPIKVKTGQAPRAAGPVLIRSPAAWRKKTMKKPGAAAPGYSL